MSVLDQSAAGEGVTATGFAWDPGATVAQLFRRTAETFGDRVAVRTIEAPDEPAIEWTWSDLRFKVDTIARGLHSIGVRAGDTVALMLRNRPEFQLCDLAAMMLGATPFSVYATLVVEQIEYLLIDAAARTVITEHSFLAVISAATARLPWPVLIVVVDGPHVSDTVSLDELMTAGSVEDFDVDAAVGRLTPDTVVTIIYTSGTTGPPKGVQLTHRNIVAAFRAADTRVIYPANSRVISWLPTAHIAERLAHYYLSIAHATETTFCPDPSRIGEFLPLVRPTWFFALPRVWEKMRSAILASVSAMHDEEREVVTAALQAGIEKVRLEQAGKSVPPQLVRDVAEADKRIFADIRRSLGLDELTSANVGGAPSTPEVLEFFHAIGVPLAENWGMSETAAVGVSNPPGQIRIGTIGKPAPGCEVRVADDGELLIRGEAVMLGYRNQSRLTEEALVDGWLYTGDVATIDSDGYVTLIDRKKEIIINSMGKNMSPAFIESRLKASSPLIGQACTIGDRRPYNTALIVLDPQAVAAFADREGLGSSEVEILAADEKVVAEVGRAVDAANTRLSRVEQIKRFTIIPGDWPPSGDELTPTMKLKRRAIAEKYRAEIDQLYAHSQATTV